MLYFLILCSVFERLNINLLFQIIQNFHWLIGKMDTKEFFRILFTFLEKRNGYFSLKCTSCKRLKKGFDKYRHNRPCRHMFRELLLVISYYVQTLSFFSILWMEGGRRRVGMVGILIYMQSFCIQIFA